MFKFKFMFTMSKKGQASLEFIVLFGFLFFIFIAILGAYVNFSKIQHNERDYSALEDIVGKINMEIVLASNVKDGYTREFEVPMKAGQKDYSLTVIGRDVSAKIGLIEQSELLPEFTGNITKGKNIVSKIGGVVYVSS
jgi:uncharacterized protein (UPF0333 family)